MEKQGMNRREFLVMAGGAVAAIPLVAALSGCGSSGGTAAPVAPAAGADFTITSTVDNTGHTHKITVKASDLAAGLQVTYTSTNDSAHTHTVTITPAQINDINAGKTDNIRSSIDLGHDHDFPVKKP